MRSACFAAWNVAWAIRFARRPALVAGIPAVHFPVVDRIPVFRDLKREVVDDADDENGPRQLRRIESGNDAVDDAEPVELVTVADCLQVQRLAVLGAVDDCYRQPDGTPVPRLTNLETARVPSRPAGREPFQA